MVVSPAVTAAAKTLSKQVDRWLLAAAACIVVTSLYLSTMAPAPPTKTRVASSSSAPPPPRPFGGVAATCCFDGPAWLQRRYTAVVANVRANVPADWALQIFHKNDDSYRRGLELNPGLPTTIVWTALTLRRKKRADLILSLELWHNLAAERVLFFSSGGALCGNGPSLAQVTAGTRLLLAADNGGLLFLASRHVALGAIDAEQVGGFVKDKHNPLAWLATRLRPSLDAHRDDDQRFAATDRYNVSLGVPFAIVSTLGHLNGPDRTLLLEQCPEAKVIFPALHHPACFGAPSTLDRQQCYASLCVTNPKPGGC